MEGLSLVHSQYVDLILCGTVARGTAVSSRAPLVVIPWFGKSCSRIHLNFTSICIS